MKLAAAFTVARNKYKTAAKKMTAILVKKKKKDLYGCQEMKRERMRENMAEDCKLNITDHISANKNARKVLSDECA